MRNYTKKKSVKKESFKEGFVKKRERRPRYEEEAEESDPAPVKNIEIKPKTDKQREALRKIDENDILFLLGSAGTGKTYIAAKKAVIDLIEGKYRKIILTRPIVESGENLGFLPGGEDEKVAPYMKPLFYFLREALGNERYDDFIFDKKIEVFPLAYMRGTTFKNTFIVIDEAQNMSNEQIKMALTRIGEGSKIVVTADPEQSDLRKENDLIHIAKGLTKIDRIDYVSFGEEDIVRHPLINSILKVFKEIKQNA